VSRRIVELYEALREDERLQKDWEQNQPREDRCIGAPLIVMAPREIATAALIWLKVQFEPGIQNLDKPDRKDLCKGGPRHVKVIKNAEASRQEKWATLASPAYCRDRKAQNDLVRCHWSPHGLRALAGTAVEEFQAAQLKVTNRNAPLGIIGVAGLLVKPPVPINRPLPKIPVVGEEEGDAITVRENCRQWA
jgi:hypothetical protein